jgi:hypothetical protein
MINPKALAGYKKELRCQYDFRPFFFSVSYTCSYFGNLAKTFINFIGFSYCVSKPVLNTCEVNRFRDVQGPYPGTHSATQLDNSV